MTPTLTPMPPDRSRAIRAMLVAEAGRAHRTVRSPRVAVLRRSAFALAAAAVAAGTVLIPEEPAGPAYGSWTAMPDTGPGMVRPPSDDIEMWASRCTELAGGGVAVQGVPADPGSAAERQVLVDRRGDFTYCVDVTAGSGTRSDPLIALAAIRSENDSVQQTWTTVADEPVALPSGEDVLLLGGTVRDDGPAAGVEVRSVFGAVGPEVTGIELRLADGTAVTATVQAGLWAAWWPTTVSRADLERLVVRTASGERVVEPGQVALPMD